MCARTQRALSSSSSALRRFLRGVRARARAHDVPPHGRGGGVSLSPVVAGTASLCFFGFLFLVAPLLRALSLLLGRGARACRPPLALLGLLGRNAPRVLGVALGDLARA